MKISFFKSSTYKIQKEEVLCKSKIRLFLRKLSFFMRFQVCAFCFSACAQKRAAPFVTYPKGQFFKNTVYLERGMPYFVFVFTNALLVKKK